MTAEGVCDYCHLPLPPRRRRGAAADPATPLYCCSGCALAARITQARGDQGELTWLLTRLGSAVFLSMAVMMFSVYLYSQEIYAVDVEQTPLASSLHQLMRYLCLLFATPVFFILGWPVLVQALRRQSGSSATDVLIVLGVAAAFGTSYAATLRETGDTYYETGCMILVLLTLGRWLEASGKHRAAEAVEGLRKLMPERATVLREGHRTTVDCDALRVGDRLAVAAGERIAADGIIEDGEAGLDEQIVTGESAPATRVPGDAVRAGTLNIDGSLLVRVTAVGAESTLGRLIELIRQARLQKGLYQRLAERTAAAFLPLTLIAAGVAAALGLLRGGVNEAVLSSLAVLLIACPCALGIATPMAAWAAQGLTAAAGVLVKGGDALERLARVRAFAFDKTGTLTDGLPRVTRFETEFDDPAARRAALTAAAGLCAGSTHVLSAAIARFAAAQGAEMAPWSGVRTEAGRGLLGEWQGRTTALGSARMMEERSIRWPAALSAALRRAGEEEAPVACLALADDVAGVFVFDERLAPDAADALRSLRSRGLHVEILTGDLPRRAARIASQLHAPARGGLLPEDKVERIRRMQEDFGPVAMVGDGLNDAGALAAADVSIALGCGADLSRRTADVTLAGDDLMTLPWLVDLARKTVRTMRVNLFWAFFYNTAGMALAVTGRLSPVFAALAMLLSSLLVLSNSLRLTRHAYRRPAAAPREGTDETRPVSTLSATSNAPPGINAEAAA